MTNRMSADDVNRWIKYHSAISYTLTMERTALESALIPVTAYIVIACVEAYRRYPDMIEAIEQAERPEALGREGHRLNSEIDPVRLWGVPNFVLTGRKVLTAAGLVDPADDERRLGIVFDFWERAPRAPIASTTARIKRPTPTVSQRRFARTRSRSRQRASRSPTRRSERASAA